MSPVVADCVAKVSAEKLWNRNLKQSNRSARFLNQHCALAPKLESILRARMRKIVLQHNRGVKRTWRKDGAMSASGTKTDIDATKIPQCGSRAPFRVLVFAMTMPAAKGPRRGEMWSVARKRFSKLRHLSACWLLALPCLLANAIASAAGSETHAYLLRGIFNVSVGLDVLASTCPHRPFARRRRRCVGGEPARGGRRPGRAAGLARSESEILGAAQCEPGGQFLHPANGGGGGGRVGISRKLDECQCRGCSRYGSHDDPVS